MLNTILQLDGQLLVAIQSLHTAWLDPIVSCYTKLGDAGLLWIVLSLAMLFYTWAWDRRSYRRKSFRPSTSSATSSQWR